MVYVFLFIIVIFCIYKYDFLQKNDIKKKYCFLYILLICISISAFKYRVGSDILAYMEEYKTYPLLSNLSFENIFENSDRQPGWVILTSFLKSISNKFTLFQIVQAIFINTIIFLFIKRNTKYVFTCILLYLVYMYTELNFEVMRESFSVGFFILGIEAFKQKKWWKYYLFALGAISFHLSSCFLFLIPLIRYLPVNKLSMNLYYVLLAVLMLYFLPFLKDFFSGIIFWGRMEEKSTVYLSSSRYDTNLQFIFIVKSFILFSTTYYGMVLYDLKNKQIWLLQLSILYFLFDILNRGIPFFYRFNNYIVIIYVLLIADFIHSLISIKFFHRCRGYMFIFLLLLFCYLPIKTYFSTSDYNQAPPYIKYYPYYSIFLPQKDIDREKEYH